MERDEANYMRERNLAELRNTWDQGRFETGLKHDETLQKDRQTFESGENDKTRTFEGEQTDKKISSDKEIAGMRAARSGSKPVKIGEDENGNPIYGVYDDASGEIVPIDVAGSGKTDPNAELTQAELERARTELSTAGGADKANDWIPGNEPSDDQVKARAYENRKGGGSAADKPSAPAQSPAKGPKAGDVVDGYEFIGGNPNDAKSWKKAGDGNRGLVGSVASPNSQKTGDEKSPAPKGKMSASSGSEFKGKIINSRAGKMYQPPQAYLPPMSLEEAQKLGYVDANGKVLK